MGGQKLSHRFPYYRTAQQEGSQSPPRSIFSARLTVTIHNETNIAAATVVQRQIGSKARYWYRALHQITPSMQFLSAFLALRSQSNM